MAMPSESTPPPSTPASASPIATASATPDDSLLVTYGNFLFRSRDAVFPIALVALLVAFRPEYPAGSPAMDRWLDAGGFALALVGQLLRVAVVGYAYIIRGGKNRRVYAEGLVTEGFFAHARNPLYVGNLLILAGLLLIWNSRWMYIIGVPFFTLGYIAIVAAEEHFLRAKFGRAYDEYCARVNRWIPDIRGLRDSVRGREFNWRRVILKEYGSAAYWLAGAVLLLAIESRVVAPPAPRGAGVSPLMWLLVPLVAGWGLARWAKKSRRLRESA